MTIFATRDQKMKVAINGNFIAEKNENLKILSKTHVIYLKRKLRTNISQIQDEKVRFLKKNKNSKILSKTHVIYLKRKLKTFRNQF